MKKLLLILCIAMSGCKHDYPSQTTTFVISEIDDSNIKGMASYLAIPIETKSLNIHITWFTDSIKSFNIGDTIKFARSNDK